MSHALMSVAFVATVAAASPAPVGSLLVGWENVGQLFRQRYEDRSPDRHASEAAALRETVGGAFRFDPVLEDSYSRSRDGTTDYKTTSVKVSQGSPWGTSFDVHRSETQQLSHSNQVLPDGTADSSVAGPRQGITVRQQLLRDGPYAGLVPGDLAAAKRQLDELDHSLSYDAALHKTISAFLAAQKSSRYSQAANASLARATAQNAAVLSLVKSGYKAKADQLISGASEVRARLRLEGAKRSFENAVRDLQVDLYQTDGDAPLVVSQEPVPQQTLHSLEALTWPVEPPSLARERVNHELAALNIRLAARKDLPALAVEGTVDRLKNGGSNAPDHTIEKSLVVTLSVPLISGITRDDLHLARFDASSADAKYAATASRLATEHQTLGQKIGLAIISLKAAQDLLDLAQQSEQLEMQKYKDGKSTIMDLRRAQEDDDSGELAVIDATSDLIQARLDFSLSSGLVRQVFR